MSVLILPATTTSTVFDEAVENDHRYRVQMALHRGQGRSRWSGSSDAVGTPLAPPVRHLGCKRTTSSTESYLHDGWSRQDDLGSPGHRGLVDHWDSHALTAREPVRGAPQAA